MAEIQDKRDEGSIEKRKYNECESEDEDFAGFEVEDTNGLAAPAKKMRESTPDTAATQNKSSSQELSNNTDVVTKDEILKKPFKLGWKRELVYRASAESITNPNKKGDVYYITPNGKKCRSRVEVASNMHGELSIDNFSFLKEPVGGTPDEEIIRVAKLIPKAAPRVHVNVLTETTVLGKRVPKPKMPKGASPPPISPRSTQSKTPPARSNSQTSPRNSTTYKMVVKPVEKTSPSSTDAAEVIITTGKMAKLKNKSSPNVLEDNKKGAKQNSRLSSPQSTENVADAMNECKTPLGVSGSNGGNLIATETKRNTLIVDENRAFATNFFSNVSVGYEVLFQTFQYLKVQELLRASCVCRMWNQVANHPRLWRTVRMKNSHVNDWVGLANTLSRNGTKHLDLRKMLISGNSDEMWQSFSDSISTVDNLERIDLCRCSSTVVENLLISNPNLKVLNALTIKSDSLNLENAGNLAKIEELRLKSSNGLSVEYDLAPIRTLVNLRHLSLTTFNKFGGSSVNALRSLHKLESLELGECTELDKSFAEEALPNLKNLQRLRLEKGQDDFAMFEILDCVSKLDKLQQLELINCDVKIGFDKYISKCRNIKKLLLIPTYVSQSAATNHMVLKGVSQLSGSLQIFIWTVTVELLRVTELYVDQCDKNNRDDKNVPGESIPILKPVPGKDDENTPIPDITSASDTPAQVEIVPLAKVQSILYKSLSTTRIKILKIPFQSTWKQNMIELP